MEYIFLNLINYDYMAMFQYTQRKIIYYQFETFAFTLKHNSPWNVRYKSVGTFYNWRTVLVNGDEDCVRVKCYFKDCFTTSYY